MAALVLTSAQMAGAKAPKPITVSKTAVGKPLLLVDSKGTVNLVWSATNKSSYNTVKYARLPKGAKHFKTVSLPHVFNDQYPFMFQPSSGGLEIIVTSESGNDDLAAFRSTNDGKSWRLMNTSALNDPTLKSNNIYLNSQYLFDAPDGPIEYEQDAGSVVQINNALTKVTTVANGIESLDGAQVVRTPSGTTFALGVGSTRSTLPFQVGSHTGQVTFPTCEDLDNVPGFAAGKSVAVVAETGCGHTWIRTVSASGTVGKLTTIGNAPKEFKSGDISNDGTPVVSLISQRNGRFTAVFARPGNDLAVSHSKNGSHWSTSSRSIPVAGRVSDLYGDNTVSGGAPTWYAGNADNGDNASTLRAVPLAGGYKPPSPPSGHGFRHPRHGSIGSLAATVPGKVALKKFRKTGHVTVRLVDALPEHVSISVSDTRVKGDTTYDICSGGPAHAPKLAANHPKTLRLTCAGGAIVIGGTAGSGVDAHKGDLLTFGFQGRNGPISIKARVA